MSTFLAYSCFQCFLINSAILCLLIGAFNPFILKVIFFLFIYLFIYLFYCYSITLLCLFSPTLHPNPGEPTSLPPLHPPLGFVHVSFIVVPVIPSPHCPLPTPLWLLLDCSFFFNLFIYFLLLFNYSCMPFLPIPPPHPS